MAFVACATVLLSFVPAPANAFSITQWDLGVMVDGDGLEQDFSVVVQNPYNGSLLAAPTGHLSSAASQHQFAWAQQFGTFLIQSQQLAAGQPSGSVWTTASGSIWLSTVTEPLSLHIDASWTYSMPADFMMSRFSVLVRSDEYPSTVLFHQSYQPQTWPGDPWSGTLTIQADVILPPGPTWIISYNMQLEADAGPSFSASGSGYVNLTISPEVSSLAFLAPLLFVVSRRAAHHRHAVSP